MRDSRRENIQELLGHVTREDCEILRLCLILSATPHFAISFLQEPTNTTYTRILQMRFQRFDNKRRKVIISSAEHFELVLRGNYINLRDVANRVVVVQRSVALLTRNFFIWLLNRKILVFDKNTKLE